MRWGLLDLFDLAYFLFYAILGDLMRYLNKMNLCKGLNTKIPLVYLWIG